MKNTPFIRIGLRLTALTLALAAGGFLLRSRPTPTPSTPPRLAAPVIFPPSIPIIPPAPYKPPPKPLKGAGKHLARAKIEPITFPGYRVRATDTYDWLPDGRALLVRYAGGEKDHHAL